MPMRNNVTRLLDARQIPYTPVEYDPSRFHSAAEVAALIGVPVEQVYKTIVVLRVAANPLEPRNPRSANPLEPRNPRSANPLEPRRSERGGRPLLVIVPGDREIDLRRLAGCLGEKKLRVAPQREAEALTRLQVGGISALALTGRGFEVYLDRSAQRFARDGIYVSGGQRGLNLRIRPADLLSLTDGRYADATAQDEQSTDGA